MVPVFLVPFAAYLHFRLEPRGQGVRWFVVLSLVVFLVRALQAVPASPTLKVGVLLILLAFSKFCGRLLK